MEYLPIYNCQMNYKPRKFKIMKRKKSEFMKLISLTVILAIVVPVLIQAQAGKANFAGNWVLNAEKSTQPQNGSGNQRMGGGNFTVAQEANLLTRTNRPGWYHQSQQIHSHGKECINTTGRGESKSTAKWSGDGKTMTIASRVNFTVMKGP